MKNPDKAKKNTTNSENSYPNKMGNTIERIASGLSSAKSAAEINTAVNKISSEIFTNSQSRVDASNSTKVIPTIIDTINKKLIWALNSDSNKVSNEIKATTYSNISTLWRTLYCLCDRLLNRTACAAARSRCVGCGVDLSRALTWTMTTNLLAKSDSGGSKDLFILGDLLNCLFDNEQQQQQQTMLDGKPSVSELFSTFEFVEALAKMMQVVIGSLSTAGTTDDGTVALLRTLAQVSRFTKIICSLLDPSNNPRAHQKVGPFFGRTKEIVFALRNCFDPLGCVENGDQLSDAVKYDREKMTRIFEGLDEAFLPFLHAVKAVLRDQNALQLFAETDSAFVHGFLDLFTTAQMVNKRQKTGTVDTYLRLQSILQNARADKLTKDLLETITNNNNNTAVSSSSADKIIFELNFKIQHQESFQEAIATYSNIVPILGEYLKANDGNETKPKEGIEETKQYIQNILKYIPV